MLELLGATSLFVTRLEIVRTELAGLQHWKARIEHELARCLEMERQLAHRVASYVAQLEVRPEAEVAQQARVRIRIKRFEHLARGWIVRRTEHASTADKAAPELEAQVMRLLDEPWRQQCILVAKQHAMTLDRF